MKLISAIAVLFLPFTFGEGTCDDNRSKAIQVPVDCPEETQNFFRNNNIDGDNRCATTLFPPGDQGRDLPPVTYTWWKCGLGDKGGCTCGISDIVTAMPGEIIEWKEGAFLSEHACNAQCSRGGNNKCWVCVQSYTGPPGPMYTTYSCEHKADAPSSYLGQPGMTLIQCNTFGVCPVIEELPYYYDKKLSP